MKKIVRLTENDLTRIVKRVLKEQEVNKFDAAPFETLKVGGKKWNIWSKDSSGKSGYVSGSIMPMVTTSNGEYVILIDIMFPAGDKQAVYRGELLKTSKAATGKDDVGTFTWRAPMKNERPGIDSSKSYFTDGSRKISVDEFMKILSNNQNASAFVEEVLNPLIGLK